MEVKINELPELTDPSGSHIVGYKGNDTVQIPTDAVVSKAQEIISDAYSATKAYTIGEYCIYNNSLYKCIANTSAGIAPTNSTYWTSTSVSEELASNAVLLGYVDVPQAVNESASFNFSTDIKKFNFLYIFFAYYNNGAATYGCTIIPVSLIRLGIYQQDWGVTLLCMQGNVFKINLSESSLTASPIESVSLQGYIGAYGI